MATPYETLGVSKQASAKEIRKAFRKRALASHPDRGGDRRDFEMVVAAHDVLGDEARRARYDQTGETGTQPGPDNATARVMSVLSGAFFHVVEKLSEAGQSPKHHDLVALMKQGLNGALKQIGEAERGLLGAKAKIGETRGRFTVDEGENLLESLLTGQLAHIENELKKLDQQRDLHKQALEMLKHYRFKTEPQGFSWDTRYTGTSSATSSMGS